MQKKVLIGRVAIPMLAIGLTLGACGGGDDNGSSTPATPPIINGFVPVVPFEPVINGTVLDGETGLPVAGATVQTDTLSATTGVDGKFSLSPLPVDEHVLLRVSKTDYADNVIVTEAVHTKRITVLSPLLPVNANSVIDPAVGGTVTAGAVGQVVLPAASLVRSDGMPIVGSVTVRVTPINPAVNSAAMLGDYRADRPGAGGAASTPSSIESFGAVTATLVDASGARVDAASNVTATIRIPLATRSSARPATVPLFYFDGESGKWVEQGTATLGGVAPNEYYEGSVSHLGTWSAGQYYDSVNATGCLQDDRGRRVAGARVVSDGIDYSGTTSANTNATGNFSIAIKASATAILTAQNGTRFSNSTSVGPSTSAVAVSGGCLVVPSDANGVNIRLTWGARPLDVDSHLFTPSGAHILYSAKGSLTAAPYAKLDVDDTQSFGPEIVTLGRLMVGTYRYALHNFSNSFAPGIAGSPTRVEFNSASTNRVFLPASGEGANNWWHAFDFTVDAQCNVTVTPVGTWSESAPTAGTSEPMYCTVPTVAVVAP